MTDEERDDLLRQLKDAAASPPEIVHVFIDIRKGDLRTTLSNSFAAHTYRELKDNPLHQDLFALVLSMMGKQLEPHLDLMTRKPDA